MRIKLRDGHTLIVREWSRNELTARLEFNEGTGQPSDRIEIDFGSIEFEGEMVGIGRVVFTR